MSVNGAAATVASPNTTYNDITMTDSGDYLSATVTISAYVVYNSSAVPIASLGSVPAFNMSAATLSFVATAADS